MAWEVWEWEHRRSETTGGPAFLYWNGQIMRMALMSSGTENSYDVDGIGVLKWCQLSRETKYPMTSFSARMKTCRDSPQDMRWMDPAEPCILYSCSVNRSQYMSLMRDSSLFDVLSVSLSLLRTLNGLGFFVEWIGSDGSRLTGNKISKSSLSRTIWLIIFIFETGSYVTQADLELVI